MSEAFAKMPLIPQKWIASFETQKTVAPLLPVATAFIWYFICSSRPISYWFASHGDLSNINYLDGSPLDRMVYLVLIAVAAYILWKAQLSWGQITGNNLPMFVLFSYMLVTVIWSPEPLVSFKRWIKSFGSALIIISFLCHYDMRDFVDRVLIKCFMWHLPVSLLLIVFAKNIGISLDSGGDETWTGLTTHKNSLGEVCMLSAICFFWSLLVSRPKNRGAKCIYLILSLSILLLSRSATALVITILGISIIFIFHKARLHTGEIRRLAAVSLYCVIGFMLIFPTRPEIFTQGVLGSLIHMSGRQMTLTGRTDLWYDLIKIAGRHNLMGLGFGGFWIGNTHNLWNVYLWKPNQAHNGYVDVYIQTGLIGLCLLVVVLVSCFKRVLRGLEVDFNAAMLQLAILFIIILHNVAESSFLRGDHHLWFVFLLIVFFPLNSKKSSNRALHGELYQRSLGYRE